MQKEFLINIWVNSINTCRVGAHREISFLNTVTQSTTEEFKKPVSKNFTLSREREKFLAPKGITQMLKSC